ncbi:autotransporter domain-containing protein [Cognatishimia sp. MH4019]|uniref:autotransporter domain-containing protein n=1 Tax=Cognatishimia sp. MH4019 TaxID=2854030 RepID=UPI001CD79459|nr:autotransporter domain-containing protein [Cognatishimia sp. MH4019]
MRGTSVTLAVAVSTAAALPVSADDVVRQIAAPGAPGLAGQSLPPASFVLSSPARVSDFGYLLNGGAGGTGLAGTAGSNGVTGTTIGVRATAPTRAFVQATVGLDGTNTGNAGDGGDVTGQSVLIRGALEAPKGGVHITAGSGGTGGRGGDGGDGGSVADLADWRDLLRTNLPGSFNNDGLQGAGGQAGGAGQTGGTGGVGGALRDIVVENRAAITSRDTAIALRSGDGGAGGRGGDSGDGGDAADGAIRGVTPGQPNVLDGADAADQTGSNRPCPTRNNVLRCGVRGRGGLFGNIVNVSNPFADGPAGGNGGTAGAGGLGSSGGDLLDARVVNAGRLTVSGIAGADGILLQGGQGGDGGRGRDGGDGGKGGRGSDGLHGSNGGDGGDGGDGQDGGVSGLDPIAGYDGGNGGDGADGGLGGLGRRGGHAGDGGIGGTGGSAGSGGSVAGARLTNSGTIRAIRDGIRIVAGAGGRGGNAGDSGRAGLGGDGGDGGNGGQGGAGGAGGEGGEGGCVVIGIPPAAFTRCASDGDAGDAGSDGNDQAGSRGGVGGNNGAIWTVFATGSGGQGGSVQDNLVVNTGQISVLGDGVSFIGGGGGAVGDAGAAGIAPSTISRGGLRGSPSTSSRNSGGLPGARFNLTGSSSVGAGGDVTRNTVRNAGRIEAGGIAVAFEGGAGNTVGVVRDNAVFNSQTGNIVGTTGVSFGAGTGNRVENLGRIEGTGGTAIRFTSGKNHALFGKRSQTLGAVQGGSGDDTFVLRNDARVTGVLAGNGQDRADTIKLEFKRVLPRELAAFQKIRPGDGTFTFRFKDYAYASIEAFDLSSVSLANFEGYGIHPDRKRFGRMLDNLPLVTPQLDAVLTDIDEGLVGDIAKDAALGQLMPEVHDMARVHQMGAMRARAAQTRGGGSQAIAQTGRRAKGAKSTGLSFWADGRLTYDRARFAGDTGQFYGGRSRDVRVGFETDLGGGATTFWGYAGLSAFDADADQSRSELRGESTLLGFGLRHGFAERLYVEGGLSFGWDSYDVTRGIAFGTTRESASARYNGTHQSAHLRLGVEAGQLGGFALSPQLGLEYFRVTTEAFEESGAGDLNLSVDAQEHHSLDLVAALDARRVFAMDGGGALTLDMSGAVHFNLDQSNRYSAELANIPGSAFEMIEDTDDTVFAAVGLRLTHRPARGNFETFVAVQGQLQSGTDQFGSSVSAGFAMSF